MNNYNNFSKDDVYEISETFVKIYYNFHVKHDFDKTFRYFQRYFKKF